MHLLVILLLLAISTALGGLGLLSADTTRAAATEWRVQGEVNVLLGVETDDERRNVDNLLANTDVALADENTSVVDRLGKTELVDASLETTLQEILELKGKHVIELHAGLVEDTDADETANEGIAFEQTLGVLLVEGKKLTTLVVSKEPHDTSLFPRFKVIGKFWSSPTGQHDESWTESDRLARPHAYCAGHTRQRASTQSPCCIYVSFDHNRLKQSQALVQWPVVLTIEQTRKVCGGHGRSSSGRGEAS